MFVAQFLPNFVVFLLGQSAAWYYLRSGRVRIGVVATVALWVLADWLLVARHVFSAPGEEMRLPTVLLQGTALWVVLALLWAQWRRRWSADARARGKLFGAAMQQYLGNDLAMAVGTYRRLVWADPWDAAAWAGLGVALARASQQKKALACYRRAEAVDRDKRYVDFVRHQRALLQPKPPAGPSPAPAVVVADPATAAPGPAQ